jgi:hypothetical protein
MTNKKCVRRQATDNKFVIILMEKNGDSTNNMLMYIDRM